VTSTHVDLLGREVSFRTHASLSGSSRSSDNARARAYSSNSMDSMNGGRLPSRSIKGGTFYFIPDLHLLPQLACRLLVCFCYFTKFHHICVQVAATLLRGL
jgi:hypothetical protein